MKKSHDDLESFEGKDKTVIRQILHPNNTRNGVRFSLAHFTLGTYKRSAPHKLRSAEIYYILRGVGKLHLDDQVYDVKKMMQSTSCLTQFSSLKM